MVFDKLLSGTGIASQKRRIATAYFLYFATFGLYLPYFPAYLRERGVDGVGIGVILAIYPLMRWVLPPIWGLLSDRYQGVKFWGSIAAWGTLAGLLILLLGEGFSALVFGAVVYFLFKSPLIPLLDSVALHHLSKSKGNYGHLRLWGSLGFITTSLGFGLVFPDLPGVYIAIALLLSHLLFALHWSRMRSSEMAAPERPDWAQYRSLFTYRPLLILLAAVFIHRVGMASYGGFFTLYVQGLGYPGSIVAWTWGIGVIMEVFIMLRVDRGIERFGTARIFALGTMVDALRWWAYATYPPATALLLLAPLHGVAFTLVYVAMVRRVGQLVGPQLRASGQGLAAAAAGGGEMVGLLLGGWFHDISDRVLFTFAGTAALIATITIMLSLRSTSEQADKSADPEESG